MMKHPVVLTLFARLPSGTPFANSTTVLFPSGNTTPIHNFYKHPSQLDSTAFDQIPLLIDNLNSRYGAKETLLTNDGGALEEIVPGLPRIENISGKELLFYIPLDVANEKELTLQQTEEFLLVWACSLSPR